MSIHFDDLLVHCRAYVANRTSDSREDSLWLDRVDQTVADLRAALSSGGPMLGVDATAAWNRRTPAPSQTAVEPVARFNPVLDTEDGGYGFVTMKQSEHGQWVPLSTLTAQAAALVAAERERDEARQIVRDIYWMAVRYADGRKSYAPGMCNDALRKAYDAGWLVYRDDKQHDLDPQYARDGDRPEYRSVEARAEAAESEVATLKARIAELEADNGD